jgi:hypothetical protein
MASPPLPDMFGEQSKYSNIFTVVKAWLPIRPYRDPTC